jgi:class 3 adenylate cyclase
VRLNLESGLRLKRFLLNPHVPLCGLIVAVLLFPFAAWKDFANLMDREMSGQAKLMDQTLNETRILYSDTLTKALAMHRWLDGPKTQGPFRFGLEVTQPEKRDPWYDPETTPFGPFPVPVSFTIALSNRLSMSAANARFQIVSDYQFKPRPARLLNTEEQTVLAWMRADPKPHPRFIGDALGPAGLTLYSPIVMNANCAACHNKHPDSPKHDWHAGDVRGMQVVSVRPANASIFSRNSWLLGNFALLIGFCGWLFAAQSRQQRIITRINGELNQSRNSLSKLSGQLAKYIPPQIHRALVEQRFDVELTTERKKLTVLFADVVDFTVMSERLAPEELTVVMNLYFDELSRISEKHGGTVNKFIGDALLVFFGHPESAGARADANACFAAAREMIAALPALNERLRRTMPTIGLRLRIGINTGIVNVGNFGSSERLDYTVIGAEVNIAARVIKAARPNTITVTDNTFACLDGDGHFEKLPAQVFKGVSRNVEVYLFEMDATAPAQPEHFALKSDGLEIKVDSASSDLRDLRAARDRLEAIIRQRERQ